MGPPLRRYSPRGTVLNYLEPCQRIGRFRSGSGDAADAELVAVPDRRVARPVDLQQLLALDVAALLVLQTGHDLLRRRINDVARRRVGVVPLQGEGHPARVVDQRSDRLDVLR